MPKRAKKNATRFGVAVHKPKALRSEAESMLIRSLLRHSFSNQLGRGQKKTPPSDWEAVQLCSSH